MYAYVSPRLRHAKRSLESSERGYVKLKTPGGSYLLPLSGLSEKETSEPAQADVRGAGSA